MRRWVAIEVAGSIWAMYELTKDAQATTGSQLPVLPAHPQQPLTRKADSKEVEQKANSKTKTGVKSHSQGTKDGPRGGKDFTKKGKNEVWEQNRQEHAGENECENCGMNI